MAISRNTVRIGTALKWRGVYDNDETYYYDNIVTASNCIFRCAASSAHGLPPVEAIDNSGHVKYSNPQTWDVILDMKDFSNLNKDFGEMLKEYYEKISHIETENLYAKVSNAGFGGTEAEMYVALVAAIRRTIETDISSPARMEVEDSLDGFIGQGETDTVTCRVLKGYLDVTPLVERWKITREGGDEASDAAWNASDKARNFSGTIDLTPGDLSIYRQSTIFRVTAEGSFSEGAVAAEIEV